MLTNDGEWLNGSIPLRKSSSVSAPQPLREALSVSETVAMTQVIPELLDANGTPILGGRNIRLRPLQPLGGGPKSVEFSAKLGEKLTLPVGTYGLSVNGEPFVSRCLAYGDGAKAERASADLTFKLAEVFVNHSFSIAAEDDLYLPYTVIELTRSDGLVLRLRGNSGASPEYLVPTGSYDLSGVAPKYHGPTKSFIASADSMGHTTLVMRHNGGR